MYDKHADALADNYTQPVQSHPADQDFNAFDIVHRCMIRRRLTLNKDRLL